MLKIITLNLYIAEKMGCNCSSDYTDDEWIENLDEICEHCNCPIPPQSCNPVSVYVHFCIFLFIHTGASVFGVSKGVFQCISQCVWVWHEWALVVYVVTCGWPLEGHANNSKNVWTLHELSSFFLCCVPYVTFFIMLPFLNDGEVQCHTKKFYNCEGSCLLCV